MTPIRLLYTIPNFETAGSGRALLHVARRLDRRRFAPSICVRYRAYNAIEGEIESLGIPLVEAPTTVDARPLRSLLGRCRRAAAPLRGFDLWHSFHYLDDYTEALVARFAGARWVYTKKNMSWNHRSWWLRSWLARRIAVQNTDMMASFFGPRWLRQRAELVPRGVDLERFLPEGPGRPDLREGLGEDVLLVACVAHLVPVKGHPTLLRAVAQVPGLHLLIAGRPLDADYAESLGQLSEELGIADRVRFLGGVAEVDRLLRGVDIFALPTLGRGRMEGCPVALLEAMAAGRAAVVTDIPGSRDLVVDGESGLRVPPEDPEALVRALRRLADPGLRRRLGAGARRRVEEHYGIDLEVARHEALYLRALGRDPRVAS